jgi:hypothetical protein
VPPYQCALKAGSPPAGIGLTGCVLSGTPPVLAGGSTMSISAPFTVTITDSASAGLADVEPGSPLSGRADLIPIEGPAPWRFSASLWRRRAALLVLLHRTRCRQSASAWDRT